MAYQSLYRRYRPQRFAEVRGQEHLVAGPAERRPRRPGRPRLPVQRAPGHGQDLDGPHPGQGPQLRRTRSTASRAACATRAWPSSRHVASTSTSSTPPRTTASRPSATSSTKAALGTPGPHQGVHPRRGPHALDGGVERAAEDARGDRPTHVVFVLATTDPQKVLPTIRSRTQHFELHLLSADELSRRWPLHHRRRRARRRRPRPSTTWCGPGAGSARDMESALDQVVAAGGLPDDGDALDELVEALCERDTGRALIAVERGHRRRPQPPAAGRAADLAGSATCSWRP